jgi:hypothetical protein
LNIEVADGCITSVILQGVPSDKIKTKAAAVMKRKATWPDIEKGKGLKAKMYAREFTHQISLLQ